MEQQSFLQRYNFTPEEFQQAKLDWAMLEQIREHHCAAVNEPPDNRGQYLGTLAIRASRTLDQGAHQGCRAPRR
jgi:hypothetical protein